MTSIRRVALACVASAMVALPLTAAAQTGPRNQDTYFTFSQPVELPNTTLPAGTYFFQLLDSESNRHVVKVMSQDRNTLHATLMAIPFYTNDRPSDEPQVRFLETPSGNGNGRAANASTNAIKVWFYPGRTTGHEFIYPREQAMRLAQRTGDSVLTTRQETAQVSETVADADLTRVDRAGTDAAVDMTARAEPQAAPAPAPQPPADPAPAPPARTADMTADRAERTTLPNTASLLPLLALIGVGSLAGSAWLRSRRR